MNANPASSDQGFSPPIAAELLLHGQRINVASLGPHSLIARANRPAAPGPATVRLTVGDQLTIYQIYLPHGIDPDRIEQPFELAKESSEAAA